MHGGLDMESRQEQINQIASWMGWHKHDIASFMYVNPDVPVMWEWQDRDDSMIARDCFNPFADPSDCAIVMEKYADGWCLETMCSSDNPFRTTLEVTGKRRYVEGYGKTWMEAFCNALLEAIDAE
jgi:hypothetical protein